MKDTLRERAYIMVTFGIINQELQHKSIIDYGKFTDFSKYESIFKQGTGDIIYATLEENFTRVDGSMYFLPATGTYYDTGLTSDKLVSDEIFEMHISFNTLPSDFRGLTINFGENYPVDFDIESDTGQKVEIRNNDKSIFRTEEVFRNTKVLMFRFFKMKNAKTRLRIYSILFGYGLVYYNDHVIGSTLESYVSPIGADVPQVDFKVILKNYDKYFNVDNPNSAINFLETGQPISVYYGYQLPNGGDIEWVKGNELLCSEWESNDHTATICGQDVFRNLNDEYYKGGYIPSGRTFYDLAKQVLKDAGIKSYYIDPRLKTLTNYNPIPRVPHKQALQMIANACRCILTQSRDGEVVIKSNYTPPFTIDSNSISSYGSLDNLKNNKVTKEYATLATNYTIVTGGMCFLPTSSSEAGYISEVVSDENGVFTTNPYLNIKQEAIRMYYGARIVFGRALPSGMIITTSNNGTQVDKIEIKDNIKKDMVILHRFDDFDTMKIEFTGTKEPHNRIVVNSFKFGDIADFEMTKRDMLASPTAIKQEKIKDIVVPCYLYQMEFNETALVTEKITAKVNDVVTFFLKAPAYNFRINLEQEKAIINFDKSGNYYVSVKFKQSGTFDLIVYGCTYKVVEKNAVVNLNERGKTIKWENPLISDIQMAQDLAHWLADYYRSGMEYEYPYRGNPELDVNDIIYQENDFRKNMKVQIFKTVLNFNQSFSGRIKARRVDE